MIKKMLFLFLCVISFFLVSCKKDECEIYGHDTICVSNDDGTHTLRCKNNPNHILVEECNYGKWKTIEKVQGCLNGSEVKSCVACGYTIKREIVSKEKHNYTYKYAGNGEHYSYCSNMNHSSRDDCTYEDYIVIKEASLFEEGIFESTCIYCGNVNKGTIPATHVHEFSNEWTIEKEATCSSQGYKSHHCIKDGCKETIDYTVIRKLDHELIECEGKEATCLEYGYDAYEYCLNCDYSSYKEYFADCEYIDGVCKWCEGKEAIIYKVGVDQTTNTKFAYVSECRGNEAHIDIKEYYQGCPVKVIVSCSNDNLKSITLPNTLTKIDSSAFLNCVSLESIIIPSGVRTIGNSAFSGCVNLKTLHFQIVL